MSRLLIRYVVLLAVLVCVNFFIPRLLPGDPFDTDGSTGAGALLSASARTQLRAQYHLDQPLAGQFVSYLDDLVHGDLGWSIARSKPVMQLIGERVPWTLTLVLSSIVIAGTCGVLLGVVAAWRGGRLDGVLLNTSTALAALPEFLVAIGLLLLLSVGTGWFPLFGSGSPFGMQTIDDVAWHFALPLLALVLAGTAGFALITRGALATITGAPFLLAARGRGLSDMRIALGHALPNAAKPILLFLAVRLGHVLGGALIVERIFALPGLGLLTFDAIGARDYPVLQGVFLLGSACVLLASFAVDAARLRLPYGSAGSLAPLSERTGGSGPTVGFAILGIAILIATVGPTLAPFDPRLSVGEPLLSPNSTHPFGTNDLGQDLFSAMLWGTRASITVALLAAGLATALAWSVGLTAGWPSPAGAVGMAFGDAMLAMPMLPVLVLVLTSVGPSRPALVLSIGLLAWPAFARIVRAHAVGLRTAPHVEAAHALGATRLRVVLVHVLPGTVGLLAVTLALTVRYALYAEATLAFIGLGDSANPSWATTLATAFRDPLLFTRALWPWWVLPPSVCIVLVVLAATWCARALETAWWRPRVPTWFDWSAKSVRYGHVAWLRAVVDRTRP